MYPRNDACARGACKGGGSPDRIEVRPRGPALPVGARAQYDMAGLPGAFSQRLTGSMPISYRAMK